MSQDPEGQANKTSQSVSSKPDDLVKRELTCDELDAVTGGTGTDVQAVSYSALNIAAANAGENIQTIMAETKAINNTKQMLRKDLTSKPS